jgi:hypothetical protein
LVELVLCLMNETELDAYCSLVKTRTIYETTVRRNGLEELKIIDRQHVLVGPGLVETFTPSITQCTSVMNVSLAMP